MALSFQTFNTLVSNTAAAVQGACSTLVNLTPGSVLRSILEANAAPAMWLQWLLLLLFNRQRLSTATGADVDTFVNDFGMSRLPAVAAVGAVTFSRFTATTAAIVQVGVSVITGDGTQQFVVTEDDANSFWNGTSYTIPASIASAILPVRALTAGSGGNVLTGTITLLGSAISGVDTVSNALATVGGEDPESDVNARLRFRVYIASLARATLASIEGAVASVQQGLTSFINENHATDGSYRPGNFVVTIDDGTGSPSSDLLAAVYTAVDAVRPVGSTFAVQAPTIVPAPVVLTLSVAAGVVKANVKPIVASAISSYINTLPVGATLPYSIIAKLAYDALPAGQVTNVSAITVASGTADIVPGASGVVKTSSVTVG